MKSFACRLPADVKPEELRKAIEEFNENPNVNGYLVQLPLPKHLNEDEVLSWIDPKKKMLMD